MTLAFAGIQEFARQWLLLNRPSQTGTGLPGFGFPLAAASGMVGFGLSTSMKARSTTISEDGSGTSK